MPTAKKGEIATILTIGALIVIGISTFVSSIFLGRNQVIRSKAETACDCVYSPGLGDWVWEGSGCFTQGKSGVCQSGSEYPSGPPPSCTRCEGNKCIWDPSIDPRSGQAPAGTPQCSDTGCVDDSECQVARTCAKNEERCRGDPDCCNGLSCNLNIGRCEPARWPQPECTDYKSLERCVAACAPLSCEQVTFAGGFIDSCFRCNPRSGGPIKYAAPSPTPLPTM